MGGLSLGGPRAVGLSSSSVSFSRWLWQEDRQDLAEAGESLGPWALRSDQALALEARRACLARRADDLEWELALLLQVAAGRWPSVARR